MDSDLHDPLAKQAITEVIYRYCRALDRMDRPLVAEVWHPGATVDYGPKFRGLAVDWVEWVWAQHERFYRHSHQMTNVLISVEGDRAVSETYAIVTLRLRSEPDRFVDTVAHNRYLDRWSCRDGRWAIDHRRMVSDFRVVTECEQNEMTAGATDSHRDGRDPSYELFGRP
jgi:hypothetical protein